MKHIYGPVPSRRLGLSLGVSPIPKKTCNYSCIYCQLGRTNHMTNTRKMFYKVKDIINEFKAILNKNIQFDVITIVGEGEPTLYLGLGDLIKEIKKLSMKPVAVITNGALLYEKQVRNELAIADIVLPTLDAYDEISFKKINRPYGSITYDKIINGIQRFSSQYKGYLWLEMMFMKDINDDESSISKYKSILNSIKYDRLYLNTPVRPPAEKNVSAVTTETMSYIQNELGGISIDLLDSEGFYSDIPGHQEAILSIIKRHPMNQFEIRSFLKTRNCEHIEEEMKELNTNKKIEIIKYKGYNTYRLK
ncbi:radical SAM protein [Candidatus Izemoplasma sp. B36]|uniref:radical SAM protein n=1 Tax=Candidatus Izemoplasma sp. B36 TaxID=3242468 RepID=UPI003555CA2F